LCRIGNQAKVDAVSYAACLYTQESRLFWKIPTGLWEAAPDLPHGGTNYSTHGPELVFHSQNNFVGAVNQLDL
jgi:hypothetical protein